MYQIDDTIKNVLNVGFSVECVGSDKNVSIQTIENNRIVSGDFTITGGLYKIKKTLRFSCK